MCFLICIREYPAILNSDTRKKSIRNSKKQDILYCQIHFGTVEMIWKKRSFVFIYLVYYGFIHVCDTALILFLPHYPLLFPTSLPPASMSVLNVRI